MATEPRRRPRLKNRLLFWLLVYLTLLSLALVVAGLVLNEHAERMVWRSLLNTEMNHYLQRSAEDSGYHWHDADGMRLFHWNEGPPPEELAPLAPGLHDDVWVEGILCVVLVRDSAQGRLALVLDITEFEDLEASIGLRVMALILGVVVLLGVLLVLVIGRAVRSLATLADDIARLHPERGGQRIEVGPGDCHEQQVIADAFNAYLQRNERFLERERAFIDSASHELRTPIAAIAGAAQLVVQQEGLPKSAYEQVRRVLSTTRHVERLIALLLTLAKDPKRLADAAERVPLHELLPEIVNDHHYLTGGKQLEIRLDALAECEIDAPPDIVRAAIGNLLRNAIEHSDGGTLHVRLDADASVTISDPGHGMNPEEVARIYSRLARGESRDGGGIGLDLIARLCEHFGWRLDIDGNPDGGTVVHLRFRPAG